MMKNWSIVFLMEGFDYVFHLAAYAAEGLSHFIKRFNYTNNLIGSVNLINASINHRYQMFCLYFLHRNVRRKSRAANDGRNAGSSRRSLWDRQAGCRARIKGLQGDVRPELHHLPPHNVYGDKQNIGDKYRNVVGIFMNQILSGQTDDHLRGWKSNQGLQLHCRCGPAHCGLDRYPEAYNQIFNIGADQPYSVKELARLCCHGQWVLSPRLSTCRPAMRSWMLIHLMKRCAGYSVCENLIAWKRVSTEWLNGSKPWRAFQSEI
jgi:UDP-glucose 4-epimerase